MSRGTGGHYFSGLYVDDLGQPAQPRQEDGLRGPPELDLESQILAMTAHLAPLGTLPEDKSYIRALQNVQQRLRSRQLSDVQEDPPQGERQPASRLLQGAPVEASSAGYRPRFTKDPHPHRR